MHESEKLSRHLSTIRCRHYVQLFGHYVLDKARNVGPSCHVTAVSNRTYDEYVHVLPAGDAG